MCTWGLKQGVHEIPFGLVFVLEAVFEPGRARDVVGDALRGEVEVVTERGAGSRVEVGAGAGTEAEAADGAGNGVGVERQMALAGLRVAVEMYILQGTKAVQSRVPSLVEGVEEWKTGNLQPRLSSFAEHPLGRDHSNPGV